MLVIEQLFNHQLLLFWAKHLYKEFIVIDMLKERPHENLIFPVINTIKPLLVSLKEGIKLLIVEDLRDLLYDLLSLLDGVVHSLLALLG